MRNENTANQKEDEIHLRRLWFSHDQGHAYDGHKENDEDINRYCELSY